MPTKKKTSPKKEVVEAQVVEEPTKEIMLEANSAKKLANGYLVKDVVADFSIVPTMQKLSMLQQTSKMFIKERKIGGRMVPYIEYKYSTKCLNFAFNFGVSTEIIGEPTYEEYSESYMNNKSGNPDKVTNHIQEASVIMKFTFDDGKGLKFIRTVCATHKSYHNKALPKRECIKSAMSKAYTVVAKTLGISADVVKMEEKAHKEIVQEAEEVKASAPPEKSYMSQEPGY